MKVATYNILSGGFNSYSTNAQLPQRLQILQAGIKQIKADFIGLVDTFRWKELYSEKELQTLFGFKYAFHIDMDDIRVHKQIGIAVLTNIEGVRFHKIRLKTRNCIKAEVSLNNKVIDIFTAYLDDISEDAREIQMHALLDIRVTHPTIIMGDLNSISKEDVEELKLDWKRYLQNHPEFLKTKTYRSYCVPAFKEICKARVLEQIKSQGFIEVLDSKNKKPTALTKLHPWNMSEPILRVDHIFHTKGIKASSFEVLNSPVFEYASDHYPVVCNIEVV